MGKPDPQNKFQLESLEPRLLLSGDPLWGMAPLEQDAAPDLFENDGGMVSALEVSITESFLDQDQKTDPSNDSLEPLKGMFDHLSVEMNDTRLDDSGGVDNDPDSADVADTGDGEMSYSFTPGRSPGFVQGTGTVFRLPQP